MSPAEALDPSAALKARRRAAGGGAGSDTDTMLSDRDGGAMSDASRAKRLKLKISGSPPATGRSTPQPGSRAGSPAPRAAGSPVQLPAGPPPFPTKQDIRNAIPPQGIAIKDLMKVVAHPKDKRSDFVDLVKEVARMDKERNVLVLK